MLRRLSHSHRTLKGLALAAIILLCGGQVLAGQHLHESPVLEEICALCGYFEPGLAPHPAGATNPWGSWPAMVRAEAPAAPFISRCFEIFPARAPPVS